MRPESHPDGAPDHLVQVLHDGDLASWTLAAIAVALSPSGGSSRDAATNVLTAAGIDAASLDSAAHTARAAQAAASLLKASAIAKAGELSWADQSDDALLAQGRASAIGGAAFARAVPMIPGMAELLARPDAAILDVGTGVGAMAVAYAEALPGVRVVGIDVMPRAIELARETIANSAVADRVEVRLQGIQDLDETDRYAMAWIPAPFIPEVPLRQGLRRVAAALVPGGRVALGYGRLTGTPIEQAVTRFQTVSYGGTALDPDQAGELLADAGLVDIAAWPTPPGSPALTVGRRATP